MKQRSKEWYEWRRAHLGASDAPVVMEVSPFKTPLELYQEKITPCNDEITPSYAMQRGIDLEPLALAKFEAETGYLMTPRVLVHPKYEWMSASLDGLELDATCAVEIKCVGKADHELALKGIVPEKYIPQLQHQMEVCQLEEMYYMSYVSDSDFTIFKVKKDNDYCDKLIQAELEFWNRIQERNPPPPSDKDFKSMDENSGWNALVDEYQQNDTKLRFYEERNKEIKKQLIYLADNSSAKGCGLSLTKAFRCGNVDYTNIPELKDIDLEKHRKPGYYTWTIRLKNAEE